MIESLVPVASALVGAAAALVGVWMADRGHTRRTFLDFSLSRRADTYVRLADLIVKARAVLVLPASADDELSRLMDLVPEDEWFSVQASIEVFGTPEVRKAFDEFLTTRSAYLGALRAWNDERTGPAETRPKPSGYEKMIERREAATKVSDRILKLVNAELSPRPQET